MAPPAAIAAVAVMLQAKIGTKIRTKIRRPIPELIMLDVSSQSRFRPSVPALDDEA